ncbi:MAG: hypothetical protein ACE5G7_02290 [Candidatus Hydrothermarchaeaceae archaeon]
MTRFRREHITRPDVALPLVYIIFLALAFISLRMDATRRYILAPTGAFQAPDMRVYGIALMGIILLSVSARLGSRVHRGLNPLLLMPVITFLALASITLGTTIATPLAIAIALGYPLLLFFVSRRMTDIASLGKMAYALALVFAASILVRGIPILSSVGRASAAVDPSRALFHGFAVFAAALLTAGQKRRWAAAGVLSLAAVGILSGFKSDAVAVLLAAMVTGLLLNKISTREILTSAAIILLILTGISTFIALVSYEQWKIPPLLYIVYRAGFTFSAFGMVVESSYPLGYLHGGAFLDPSQRVLSSTLLAQYYPEPRIITSTLLGPGMFDFGLIGVILTAVSIGLYLGYMYSLKHDIIGSCLYAIALIHSLILVEVGLQLTSVLLYLSLLFLMLARPGR